MIRLIEHLDDTVLAELREFCADSGLGVKAIGPLLSYGTGYDFLQAYEQVDSAGTRLAFLTKFYGDIVICTRGCFLADAQLELRDFLGRIGYHAIVAEPGILGLTMTGYIMAWDQGADCTAKLPSVACDCVWNEDLSAFYALLTNNNPDYLAAEYADWYVDFNHRIRHETAVSVLIRSEGTPVSTAAALSVMDRAVFLGAVSTAPEAEGQHFASAALKALADRFADRRCYLMCLPDKLAFYQKLGMVPVGEFTEWTKPGQAVYR